MGTLSPALDPCYRTLQNHKSHSYGDLQKVPSLPTFLTPWMPLRYAIGSSLSNLNFLKGMLVDMIIPIVVCSTTRVKILQIHSWVLSMSHLDFRLTTLDWETRLSRRMWNVSPYRNLYKAFSRWRWDCSLGKNKEPGREINTTRAKISNIEGSVTMEAWEVNEYLL